MKDPWSRFGFDDLPVENCLRYRYSSIRKQWTQDRVQVKLHPEVGFFFTVFCFWLISQEIRNFLFFF